MDDEFEKLEEPDWARWHYEGKHFEAKAVSQGEFEALKRFGDYEELRDGHSCGWKAIKSFESTARTWRDSRLG